MTARTVVVMPAFNEAAGIAGFLTEIAAAFPPGSGVSLIVVDDASTDGTADVVAAAAADGLRVALLRNAENLGHGPSTLRALGAGAAEEVDVVVSVDGDGQFTGSDIAAVAARCAEEGVTVEGCRAGRGDPWFRRGVSAATRLLVRMSCGTAPRDANTPLRAYPVSVLGGLLERLPEDLVTPNLVISSALRHSGTAVLEVPVASLPPRGAEAFGSTWQQRARLVPSRRFIAFCGRALIQWGRLGRDIR